MRIFDLVGYTLRAIDTHRFRTALILIGVAIGVGAVILLTTLGDSVRRYVTGEFSELGTNIVIVLPGRSETTGGHPPLFGETPRDLTIDDALALLRSPNIERVAPIVVGSAPVAYRGLEREVTIVGSTRAIKDIRHLRAAQGSFLPEIDPKRGRAVCVLGQTVREELFGPARAVGESVRIGNRRFRVIGILAETGYSIGLDLDDIVFIPVASAQSLFDYPSLFRVLTEAQGGARIAAAKEDIRRIIMKRHEGEDDVTIITQDSVIATFDKVLNTITLGVAGIAAISLAVAGILIMNVMLVAVAQRTQEIGLLRALGAPSRQICSLFIVEALLLSFTGALIGLGVGLTSALVIQQLYPALPLSVPLWAVTAGVGIAVVTGLMFGVLPALRAARLDPVAALNKR